MLQALARDCGRRLRTPAAAPDDADAIGAAVVGATARADLVLVIAGSSRGRADHTASVLERHGELVVHGVALRPAHPVALGVVEGTPVIGVPGYPVAAAIAFERFARPLLELLLGALPEDAPLIRVRLAGEVRAKRGIEAYVPLVLSAGERSCRSRCRRAARAVPCAASRARTRCSARKLEDGVLPAGTEVDARLLRPWPPHHRVSRRGRYDPPRMAELAQHPFLARLPNMLTIARLAVLPVFWWVMIEADDGRSTLAFVVFGVASLTDWFDGWLARRYGSFSRFGRLADPLADRLLIDSAVILLWYHGRLPLLAPALIIGRDLVLALGIGSAARHGYELSVVYLGKTATSVLMVGLGLMLLMPPSASWPPVLFWAGLALSMAAGCVYLVSVRARSRASSTSTPGGRSAKRLDWHSWRHFPISPHFPTPSSRH